MGLPAFVLSCVSCKASLCAQRRCAGRFRQHPGGAGRASSSVLIGGPSHSSPLRRCGSSPHSPVPQPAGHQSHGPLLSRQSGLVPPQRRPLLGSCTDRASPHPWGPQSCPTPGAGCETPPEPLDPPRVPPWLNSSGTCPHSHARPCEHLLPRQSLAELAFLESGLGGRRPSSAGRSWHPDPSGPSHPPDW